MKYILVIDQGTTSTRAILYDNKCNLIYKSQQDFKQYYPKVGYVEHDPKEIVQTVRKVISDVVNQTNIGYDEIQCIGITNQRETIVAFDKKDGRPLYNGIVWQCRRSQDYCKQLEKDGYNDLIYSKTGLKIDPYFSATKIKWLFDNVKEVAELAKKGELGLGTIDTYLMYILSKGKIYASDYTNASRTMLFNIHSLTWDKQLCDLFNIPIDILPIVKPSGSYFGLTSKDIIGMEVPITGVSGDQQASLFGQLCLDNSKVKVTYGTGCFLLMNTESELINSKSGLLTTLACSLDNKPNYALEGSVFMGGGLISWLKDELGLISNVSESEKLSLEVKDSNNVVIVPAFVGLGAPYWNSSSRGIITGLTRGVNKNHIVRACLEAIAYQVYDVIKAMEKDTLSSLKEIRVDGGASQNNFLMQFQADLLNMNIIRPLDFELTSKGAAYLSGITSNLFTLKEIKSLPVPSTNFISKIDASKQEELIKKWQQALKLALAY